MGIFGKVASGVASLAKQGAEAIVASIDRLANQQEFEAVIAACVLVASSDGQADEKERQTMIAQTSAHPSLQGFGAGAIQKTSKEFFEMLGMDKILGTEMLLEKVHQIKGLEGRARIIGIVNAIANADGDFSEPERLMVERIRG